MKITKDETENLADNIATIIRKRIEQTNRVPNHDELSELVYHEIGREAGKLN